MLGLLRGQALGLLGVSRAQITSLGLHVKVDRRVKSSESVLAPYRSNFSLLSSLRSVRESCSGANEMEPPD